MGYTSDELMTVVAARFLTDGDICFVGIGPPSAACNLARLTHAPHIVLVYESGTLGARPAVLPLSIGDGELCESALTTVSVVELFQYWLQGGRIAKGFLAGAQIDRFANVNTTVIGTYDSPGVRLPGGGGAPEIAAACREVLVMARHSLRTFVDRVDFVTSVGHGCGSDSRARAGLKTAGPTLVVTDLCTLAPDPETSELRVISLHQGVTRDEVQANTGWPLQFVSSLETTPNPTHEELRVLRELQARTDHAHGTK